MDGGREGEGEGGIEEGKEGWMEGGERRQGRERGGMGGERGWAGGGGRWREGWRDGDAGGCSRVPLSLQAVKARCCRAPPPPIPPPPQFLCSQLNPFNPIKAASTRRGRGSPSLPHLSYRP